MTVASLEALAPHPADYLAETHAVFRRWFGQDYDLTALDAVLAVAATVNLDGDPPWLLMLSGSGNAKTETVSALKDAGAIVTSTIASEGALLSATSRKEQTAEATGGLLRKIGDSGLLVIKDVTSILSMGREVRAGVLAALREVADGRWERNVSTDGGRSLLWEGRLVVIGAVTTAWDASHGVIASMGDRFALVRVDSSKGRHASGRQALANVGAESAMRAELAEAVGLLLGATDRTRARLSQPVSERLLAAADLVTLARTAVERDRQGNVSDAHQPEMPTRFAKVLGQIVRGGLTLGMEEGEAERVALRVAHDSIPPLRLALLRAVAKVPGTTTTDATKQVQRPRSTVDRVLQELHVLGLVTVGSGSQHEPGWRYTLADIIDLGALTPSPDMSVPPHPQGVVHRVTDKPGDASGRR